MNTTLNTALDALATLAYGPLPPGRRRPGLPPKLLVLALFVALAALGPAAAELQRGGFYPTWPWKQRTIEGKVKGVAGDVLTVAAGQGTKSFRLTPETIVTVCNEVTDAGELAAGQRVRAEEIEPAGDDDGDLQSHSATCKAREDGQSKPADEKEKHDEGEKIRQNVSGHVAPGESGTSTGIPDNPERSDGKSGVMRK
jgi:hypothetical protein